MIFDPGVGLSHTYMKMAQLLYSGKSPSTVRLEALCVPSVRARVRSLVCSHTKLSELVNRTLASALVSASPAHSACSLALCGVYGCASGECCVRALRCAFIRCVSDHVAGVCRRVCCCVCSASSAP